MENTKRTERQAHGLNNEDRIKTQFALLPFSLINGYTAKYDAQTSNGIPVSIKTEKLKSDVELGDYFRNASAKTDFYIVASFWEGEKDNIVEEYHLFIPASEWQLLFNHSMDERIRTVIKEASNDRSYDAIWSENIKNLATEYGDGIIRLRPKRDHKKQKRMQCAISYNNFLMLNSKFKTEDIRNHKNGS